MYFCTIYLYEINTKRTELYTRLSLWSTVMASWQITRRHTTNWLTSNTHKETYKHASSYAHTHTHICSRFLHVCPMIFLAAKNGSSVASESCLSEATLSFHKAKTEGNICPALSFGPSDSKYSSKSCALPWACCHMPLENVTSKSHNNSPASDPHLIFLFFKYRDPHLILGRYMLPSSEQKTIVIIGLYI